MKKLLLLLLFTVFYSCGIPYDGETRLVTELNVMNSSGQPISGKAVSITVSADDNYEVISNGITDQNGKLILIFPAPASDEALIDIDIFDNANSDLEKHFVGLHKSDFEHYKFKKDVTLFRQDEVVTLQIIPQQVTPTSEIQNITIQDFSANEYVFYNVIDFELQTTFNVLKNHTITVSYLVQDNSTGTGTVHSQEIVIGNDNVDFTLNY